MNNFIIPQGLKPISLIFVLTLLSGTIFYNETIFMFLVIVTLILAFVYRQSNRIIIRNDLEILSISDGIIQAIDKQKTTTTVYIKVSICNTHTLRAPIDGTITPISLRHGTNLNPNSFKSYKLNSMLEFKISNINFNLLSGICNSEIVPIEGSVIKGDSLGVFLDGIIKITFKNKDIKLNVNIGEKVKSGKTIIAFKNQG